MSTGHPRADVNNTSEARHRSDGGSSEERIRARLTDRARATSERANERLEAVRSNRDLRESALLHTQREIGRQATSGLAPAPAAFWERVAMPAAQRLIDDAKAVIDDEMEVFASESVSFRRSARLLTDGDPVRLARAQQTLTEALDTMETIALDPAPLDEIGDRFQRRLRRNASASLLPRSFLISPSETERIVDRLELELLDVAPYAHCDKLLVAFELAHADVRAYVRDHVRAMRLVASLRA